MAAFTVPALDSEHVREWQARRSKLFKECVKFAIGLLHIDPDYVDRVPGVLEEFEAGLRELDKDRYCKQRVADGGDTTIEIVIDGLLGTAREIW